MYAIMQVWLSQDELKDFCFGLLAEFGNELVSEHFPELSEEVRGKERLLMSQPTSPVYCVCHHSVCHH